MVKKPIQYTLRGIPARVDQVLREQSEEYGQSLNEAAIGALSRGLHLTEDAPTYHDLDALIGSWVEDPAFDAAMEDFERIDPKAWS